MNPDTLVYGATTVWANSTAGDDFLTVLLNVTQMLAPPAVSFQVLSKSTVLLATAGKVLHLATSTKVSTLCPLSSEIIQIIEPLHLLLTHDAGAGL